MTWQIEEAGTGETSGSCLMVIDRFADIEGIADCSSTLCGPDIKNMHIVFDDKISPLRVQKYLHAIRKAVKSDINYTIKHADILTIRLMGYLWEQAKAAHPQKGRNQ